MHVLKSNQQRVQNLKPWELWGFIVGRVLAAFALGIFAARYFPRVSSFVALPMLVVGALLLVVAAKGMMRRAGS